MPASDGLDRVFHALAHRDRRRIVGLLRGAPGCRVEDVARHLGTSWTTAKKHVRALQAAGLVHVRQAGRERRIHFDPAPIRRVHAEWTADLARDAAAEVARQLATLGSSNG